MLFAFDLDGTITCCEILPRLAAAVGQEEAMERLTRLTVSGAISFEQSFRYRVAMLRKLSVHAAQAITASVPLHQGIVAFIRQHREQCMVFTGNLDVWIAPVMARIGCQYVCSRSCRDSDGFLVPEFIVEKGAALRAVRAARGVSTVLAVGDGRNDVPLFAAADIGVAFGGVHAPAPALTAVAHAVVRDGDSLCRLLARYLGKQAGGEHAAAS